MKRKEENWVQVKADKATTEIANRIEEKLARIGIKASKAKIYGAILKLGSSTPDIEGLIDQPIEIFKMANERDTSDERA